MENDPQVQKVFEELKRLFREDPQSAQVSKLMKSLANREPRLTGLIQHLYEEFGDQCIPEDLVLEDMTRRIQEAIYAEDLSLAEHLYDEYTALGGKNLDTKQSITKLRARAIRTQENIPFEVKRLKGEANSALNRGLYQQAIDLANSALKILHDLYVPETNPAYEALNKIDEEAKALSDAREQYSKGMKLIQSGDWQNAFILFDKANNIFHQPYLQEQRDILHRALQMEKEILDEAHFLIAKRDRGSIERFLTLVDSLRELPKMLGTTESTTAQKKLLDQLPIPKCFLSYSRKDLEQASSICDEFIKKNIVVWFDKNDIAGGDFWKQAIYEGIRKSNILVFLMTPNSVESQWCLFERNLAEFDGKAVITVMLKECTPPVDVQHLQYIDMSTPDFLTKVPTLVNAIYVATIRARNGGQP